MEEFHPLKSSSSTCYFETAAYFLSSFMFKDIRLILELQICKQSLPNILYTSYQKVIHDSQDVTTQLASF